MGRQRQGIGADAVLDPVVAERAIDGKSHHFSIEVAHRIHVAGEDDGVVDLSDLTERVHYLLFLIGHRRAELASAGCAATATVAALTSPSRPEIGS
jgi:hypothetical protein